MDDFNNRMKELGLVDCTDYNSATLFDYNTLETLYPEFVEDFNSTNKTGYSDPVNECCFFGDRYWYHPDYLGSVAMVTNDEGVVHQFFLTNAWGEELHTYDNANTSSFNSEYRFNDDGVRITASIERCARSAELDEETGLTYYGARYYDNNISMWLSMDPLAHEYQSLSPYNFVANNPLTYVGPNGESIWILGEEGSIEYTPGMTYDGKGKFIMAAIQSYNELYAGSSEAKAIIDDVVNSKYNIRVVEGATHAGCYSDGSATAPAQDQSILKHEQSGGTIVWNPNASDPVIPVLKKQGDLGFSEPENPVNNNMSLLHETVHGLHNINDELFVKSNIECASFSSSGLDRNEWRATHRENIVRSEMGSPLRKYYGINERKNGIGLKLLRIGSNGEIISNYYG